ncbi:hypothetical protein FPQ14_09670 [Gilliamella apicola]|uniref:Virulence factor n=1 Tax=Gilliamella apicola TaxID=1196095 RepID=A0A556RIY5_9GAMM|nr:SrfA family protein [Gilliamella apicola]TSJ88826.1 hypothetical protein FPQ14_09670 [Gilliamella apicola]
MSNTLLRSGDIKDFKMLGHDGKAAYLVASQIREMFRVKLGRQYSDCLAIPQRNDQGNIVDWYIPFDSEQPDGQYDIIPWTSASEDEQKSALVLLKEFERKVIELGQKLASNPNLEGDQLLFSRLIYDPKQSPDNLEPNFMAIRFPSNQYVYIVNGKPVITFWGFVNPHTPQATSPFYCLEAFRKATPKVVSTTPFQEQIIKKPWWKRWWIWLLGLFPFLLLLLAIFWLKGCWLNPSISIDPKISLDNKTDIPVSAEINDKEDKQEKKESEPEIKEVRNKSVTVVNGVIPNEAVAVDPNAVATDPAVIDNPAVAATAPDQGKDNNVNQDGATEQPQPTSPPDDKGANPNPSEDKKDNQDVQNKDDKNGQAPPNSDLDGKSDATNGNSTQGSQSDANASQANNLALPADALKQGSTSFLNGQWSVGAGIQDKATGKPLQLSYNFNQGNGEVTVTRSDGVKCVGNVGTGIQNANLNIAGNSEAICSDNTKYQLPKIQCKSGKDNQADCKGIYDNGTSFPITMKKQ